MPREAILIFLGVIGSLKLLYEFRKIPFIDHTLSTLVALVLIYTPVLHTTLRKIPTSFFEKSLPALARSFFLFVVTTLVVFPPFLLVNHLYQKQILGRGLAILPLPDLFSLLTIQILLVAFPEEFFFRGYLQSILAGRFPKKIRFLRPLGIEATWAIPLASLLFAASHSFITLRWWHFAIFFPSLVFGWLREKTGGLVAPILFHALCNVAVNWINVAYR